jgi:hypothetical protein
MPELKPLLPSLAEVLQRPGAPAFGSASTSYNNVLSLGE